MADESCEGVVGNAWLGGQNLETKLSSCAAGLKEWSENIFGATFRELRRKRRKLKKLNRGGLASTQIEQRRLLLRDIAGLVQHEEAYWRQRSRVLWLAEGDRNTKFFHQRASGRKRRNQICRLKDDADEVHVGDEKVGKVAVDYFRGLFSSPNPPLVDCALEDFQVRVTDDMNAVLRAEYTEDEVKIALSQMHPIKAPGPDGMCPLFFQSYWHIVGASVSNMVLGVLRGNPMPRFVNKTYIALIPKKKNADRMSDFRPISLCNVVYKLVSKVLANRLKVFLDRIISVNQSAFTPGRLITDNILVAFEVFHYMKNLQQVEGCMAMKLDMSKAYDRIEWGFLEAVLGKFWFDTGWSRRIMECVTTVTFSVLINGRPSEEFTPNRGLRQGDPISPYLFILCAEVFSHLLRKAEERGALRGIRIAATAPSITHLLFADDCIIFSKATLQDVGAIQEALSLYELSSGQKVNFNKTTVSYSKGVSLVRREEMAATLGVRLVDVHDRYLGLPTTVGRSKKVITKGVKER